MSNAIATTYEKYWPVYLSTVQSNRLAMERLHEEAARTCPDCDVFHRDSVEAGVHAMACLIVDRLVQAAATLFTAPGCRPLGIKNEEWQDRFTRPLKRGCINDADPLLVYEEFSPLAVWNTLEHQYGGDVGTNMMYTEAAEALVSYFSLYRQAPAKGPRGMTSIDVSVWSEDRKDDSARLSYHSHDGLWRMTQHLLVFAQYTGREDLIAGVTRLREWASSWTSRFRSRERFPLCGDMEVVLFYSRLNFLLGPALRDTLQVFVSTYGAAMFKRYQEA